MGEPSQAQTAGGSFLEKFFGAAKGGMETAQAGMAQEKATGRYYDAMKQLKERELGAKREEDMMDPDESSSLAKGAGAPYHFTAPVHRAVVTSLIGDWLNSHTPRDLHPPNPRQPALPKFDMVAAQNKALAAAKQAMGKAAGNLAYEDYTPQQAVAFNTEYKRNLANDVAMFERINKIRTGFAPADKIVPGHAGTGLKGYLGIERGPNFLGRPTVKNTLAQGYDFTGEYGAPYDQAPPPAGDGGGGQQLKPLDEAAKAKIREVRSKNPNMSPQEMAGHLREVGYGATPEEVAGVK